LISFNQGNLVAVDYHRIRTLLYTWRPEIVWNHFAVGNVIECVMHPSCHGKVLLQKAEWHEGFSDFLLGDLKGKTCKIGLHILPLEDVEEVCSDIHAVEVQH
jgi:hypothetical protein